MFDPLIAELGLFWVMGLFGVVAVLVAAPVAADVAERVGIDRLVWGGALQRWLDERASIVGGWLRRHSPCAVVASWRPAARAWRDWR